MAFYINNGGLFNASVVVGLLRDIENQIWMQRGMSAFEISDLKLATEYLLDAIIAAGGGVGEDEEGEEEEEEEEEEEDGEVDDGVGDDYDDYVGNGIFYLQ